MTQTGESNFIFRQAQSLMPSILMTDNTYFFIQASCRNENNCQQRHNPAKPGSIFYVDGSLHKHILDSSPEKMLQFHEFYTVFPQQNELRISQRTHENHTLEL